MNYQNQLPCIGCQEAEEEKEKDMMVVEKEKKEEEKEMVAEEEEEDLRNPADRKFPRQCIDLHYHMSGLVGGHRRSKRCQVQR